jgi:hypothetical protein
MFRGFWCWRWLGATWRLLFQFHLLSSRGPGEGGHALSESEELR